jgi:hypothetical protein
MTDYMDLRPRAEIGTIDPELSPVDYLLARMRDPMLEERIRDRIAIALLPFTVPKLQATAIVEGKNFAEALERCVKRSNGAKVIPAKVEDEGAAKVPALKVQSDVWLRPTSADKRLRRL